MNMNDYVFFWGHRPNNVNDPGKCVLSQWYDSKFVINGFIFANAEQYMMYRKALLFGDVNIAQKLLSTTDPKTAKSLGRKVSNFDNAIWEENCMDIVYEANFAKFTQSPYLRKYLLSTGDKELVEASPYDKIWGIGFRVGDNRITNKELWGQNKLGIVLMRVREAIRG